MFELEIAVDNRRADGLYCSVADIVQASSGFNRCLSYGARHL